MRAEMENFLSLRRIAAVTRHYREQLSSVLPRETPDTFPQLSLALSRALLSEHFQQPRSVLDILAARLQVHPAA